MTKIVCHCATAKRAERCLRVEQGLQPSAKLAIRETTCIAQRGETLPVWQVVIMEA